MDRPALRRILLGLIGTARKPGSLDLNDAHWAALNHMAVQHRLRPILFVRQRSNPHIPPALLADWQAAHRLSAMEAMVQRAELAETCALLGDFQPVALKGAWLAATAYPEAAQRPMRDIDLLVAPDAVLAAFNTLQKAGYIQDAPAEMALNDIVRLDKHLPPLRAPRGTVIELHHRLWERDGRLDHASPLQDAIAFRGRAVERDGIRYPAPSDLLAHLIVHAVYSHRLDCGPLILTDIANLLRAAPIDWSRFWAAATENGWRDGARLLLELTVSYHPETATDLRADPGDAVPAMLIAAAQDLLLQDLDTRTSAGLAAATLKGGPARLLARMTGRRTARGETAAPRDARGDGGLLAWAGSRTKRSLRDLSRSEVRRQSRQLAVLSTWLDR